MFLKLVVLASDKCLWFLLILNEIANRMTVKNIIFLEVLIMSKKADARQTALFVLQEAESKKTFIDLALKAALQKYELSVRDRALVSQLCCGVMRYLLTLDWLIEKITGRKASKIDPWTRNILRLSFYQLVYLEKIPASAVCFEGVELAKKFSHRGAAKFVNGVLRGYLRKKNEIAFPDIRENALEYLSLKYSFPIWMVKRWIELLGIEEGEKYISSLNMIAPLIIRTNTLKTNRDELEKILQKEGLIVKKGFLPESLILKNGKSPADLGSFKKGFFQVQSESSMLVSHLLDPQPGETILDSCSAPGGKTTHLAQLMDNRGKIFGCDIYPHKLKLVGKNARRLGITIIEPLLSDSRRLPDDFKGLMNRALVDAPCSGLGVVRRKPDLKWKRKPEDFQVLSEIQLDLLQEAAKTLKPFGVLVYSVCTNEPEETRKVFNKFLKNNPEFSSCDLTPYLPEALKDISTAPEGFINLLPSRHNLDGFFIARWEKR